jgi:beta-lactamase class A
MALNRGSGFVMRVKKAKKYLVVGGCGLVLLGASFGAGVKYANRTQVSAARQNETKYNLLSKDILADKQSDIILDFTDLRQHVEAYAAKNIGKDNSSIYFQYLPTGTGFGYGETRAFTGASLIKVPYVMNLYRLAEQGKVDLDKKIPLKEEWLNKDYGNLYQQGAGYMLSYRDAARYALENSDNTAVLMILDALKQSGMTPEEEAINYLNLTFTLTDKLQVDIGAQSYTSILKCLYFSCYLRLDDSQEMLAHMTNSSFNDRLTAQLPTGVTVAHKIGTAGAMIESDCGIFYIPNRNYSLCVMLKQGDPEASKHIADISKMVYDYVTSSTATQALREESNTVKQTSTLQQ